MKRATHSGVARPGRRRVAGSAAIECASFRGGRAAGVPPHLPCFLLTLLLSLGAGCGRGKEPVTGIQDVPDPAMRQPAPADPPASPTEQPAAGAGEGSPAIEQRPDDRPIVDLANRRVYLPGRGWLTEEEFLLVYLRRPEILPPDLDMAEIHQLIGSRTDL